MSGGETASALAGTLSRMKLEAVGEVDEGLLEERSAMKWHVSAGGVGVSSDKHSYSAFGPWGEYHIWPQHPRGYDLKWADTKSIAGHGLWHDLGVFASPNEAKGFAKEHASAMIRIVKTVGKAEESLEESTEENPRRKAPQGIPYEHADALVKDPALLPNEISQHYVKELERQIGDGTKVTVMKSQTTTTRGWDYGNYTLLQIAHGDKSARAAFTVHVASNESSGNVSADAPLGVVAVYRASKPDQVVWNLISETASSMRGFFGIARPAELNDFSQQNAAVHSAISQGATHYTRLRRVGSAGSDLPDVILWKDGGKKIARVFYELGKWHVEDWRSAKSKDPSFANALLVSDAGSLFGESENPSNESLFNRIKVGDVYDEFGRQWTVTRKERRRNEISVQSSDGLYRTFRPSDFDHMRKVGGEEENPRSEKSCVPWVKVERDPVRFAKCMAIAKKIGRVDDAKRIFEITVPYLEKEDQEVILVLTLDAQLGLRGVTEVARGARDRVSVSVPDIIRPAIIEGATAIALVHNHPSTQVQPSQGDIDTTAAVKKACDAVKILLVDHVIVGGSDKYFSFHDEGML